MTITPPSTSGSRKCPLRRFIHNVVLIPAMVTRRARTITIRLIGWQPSLDRMFSAWRTIEATGFG